MQNPFRYFNSSPEVIRLTVMMYIRFPLSLRQVEDMLFERGINICHETVRFWWNRFGPMFAAEIRQRRVIHSSYSRWRWHLDEVFVRINGETHYLWRAVDHEGEVLEVFAAKRRDRKVAMKFLKHIIRRCSQPKTIVADRLRSYGAAMKGIGNLSVGSITGPKTYTSHFDDAKEQWQNSGTSRPCRKSLPFTPRSTTI